MKTKIIIKGIFVFFLIIILIGLIYIIFTKTGYDYSVNTLKLVDYVIDDRSEECDDETELIYSQGNSKYYLPCNKSSKIYLIWDDGVVDSLKNAIDNEKVDMKSLKDHGLELIEHVTD